MKLAAAHLTLAHCALALQEQGIAGPRLDLYIPAAPTPGAAGLTVLHSFPAGRLGPCIAMEVFAHRPSPANAHRRLSDPILFN